MEKAKRNNLIGQLLFLSATIIWGSTFVVLKDTIQNTPPFFVIGVRFLSCAIIFFAIFFKKMIKMSKKTFVGGLILGLAVAAAYLTQTQGLVYTTPARNAFLTSLYNILCPFLLWLMFKERPKSYHVISALICVVGIGLVAFSNAGEDSGNTFLGDGLTLMSAVFFALQIIFIDRFQDKDNTIHLLFMEFLVVGVVLLLSSAVFELPKCGIKGYKLNGDQLLRIGYLLLIGTLYAQSAQVIGQRLACAPNQSAIILSLEAVFGTLFSVFLGYEKVSFMLISGFAVIFVAMMISELKIDLLKPFVKNKKPKDES